MSIKKKRMRAVSCSLVKGAVVSILKKSRVIRTTAHPLTVAQKVSFYGWRQKHAYSR